MQKVFIKYSNSIEKNTILPLESIAKWMQEALNDTARKSVTIDMGDYTVTYTLIDEDITFIKTVPIGGYFMYGTTIYRKTDAKSPDNQWLCIDAYHGNVICFEDYIEVKLHIYNPFKGHKHKLIALVRQYQEEVLKELKEYLSNDGASPFAINKLYDNLKQKFNLIYTKEYVKNSLNLK